MVASVYCEIIHKHLACIAHPTVAYASRAYSVLQVAMEAQNTRETRCYRAG